MTIPPAVAQAFFAFSEQKKTGELHLLFKDGQLMQVKEIKVSKA